MRSSIYNSAFFCGKDRSFNTLSICDADIFTFVLSLVTELLLDTIAELLLLLLGGDDGTDIFTGFVPVSVLIASVLASSGIAPRIDVTDDRSIFFHDHNLV